MRVIAGRLKGRQLKGPSGLQIRPTADRVKEALFSILGPRVVGARVLDLYAGTGALGIEALSRGAAAVTFVESHPQSLELLRRNLHDCEVLDQADVQACRVEVFLTRGREGQPPYQVLLADPPYRQMTDVERWGDRVSGHLMGPDAIAAIEHARKLTPPRALGPLSFLRTYPYGDTALSIYWNAPPEATE
jgi:16S rRNA (guanine(966)-N(2))-methyltransferase RsmD